MRGRMLTAVLAATLVVAGCSGGDAETAGDEGARDGFDGDAGGEAGAPAEDEAVDDSGGADGGTVSFEDISLGAPIGRKVIRDADLELAVTDADATVREITSIVERAGGFVAGAELYHDEDHGLLGNLSLRVPTDRMTTTLEAIEATADEVRSRTLGSQDVTGEYTDIEANLRNLRALEVELLELLTQVRESDANASEILTVFERIRQVRAEIEQYEGRKQLLDDLVALATIDVRLVAAPGAGPIVAQDGWSPGGVARDALRSTVAVLQTIADAAIWVALTALPVVVVLALPVVALWAGYRRYRRRDPGRPAGTPAA
jgi:hypothetical protein